MTKNRFILLGFIAALCIGSDAFAGEIFATRTLKANTILAAGDLEERSGEVDGLEIATLVGLETRKVVFKGQKISAADVAPAALVERNQPVLLVYSRGGLSIETEGRALDRGRAGDVVRVMNLGSRSTVTGVVDELGAVRVGTKN